jgi:hypothetical protein
MNKFNAAAEELKPNDSNGWKLWRSY